ncbi:MAG: hypothetical protein ABFS38_14955 [Bacteroidota bacterium]
MKTQRISSNNNSHYYLLIMAVVTVFTCIGCSEPLPMTSQPAEDELFLTGEIISENFRILPSGATVNVLNGSVILEFAAGTVATPTRFTIVSFPLDHHGLEKYNKMKRGISITNVSNDNKIEIPIKITMRYDLVNFNNNQPDDESDLSIYKLFGDMHAYHKIESIGECCVNCSCKTISGCIDECGSFVVAEN